MGAQSRAGATRPRRKTQPCLQSSAGRARQPRGARRQGSVPLGPDANLANWTGEAGDAAAARDQYAALLPVHERVFGADHPSTRITRANLAHWTR